jgi:hypothetical protein
LRDSAAILLPWSPDEMIERGLPLTTDQNAVTTVLRSKPVLPPVTIAASSERTTEDNGHMADRETNATSDSMEAEMVRYYATLCCRPRYLVMIRQNCVET